MANSIFYRAKRRAPARPRQKKRRFFWRGLRTLLKLSFLLLIFSALGLVVVFAYFAKDLPDPRQISQRPAIESTKIFDRTGQVILYDIHGEEKRTRVPLNQISPLAQQATIVIEDADFYQHFGLNFRGILRAIFHNLAGRRISQGGSTITQQLIKSSFLTPERTFSRKIKEAVLALELERKYAKDEILEFYLNQIPYGSNAYGIEAAAQTFFGKSAKELSLAESAALASLPQAPSRLSPFGSRPEELKTRQQYLLDRMARYGYISPAEAQKAKEEKLKFVPQTDKFKAPHFVIYVKEYLEEKYGADYIEKAGLKAYTTLDWELQQAAEKIVQEGAQKNWSKYKARNASLAALDPQTGQILALVGSSDYFDLEHDGNVNVTIRPRQPGSSFKPFAYAVAFKKGYTPDTVLFDLITEFNPNCSPDSNQEKDQFGLDCYHPGNYDEKTRGPVTARQALAQSLNIPSVQMLYLAGLEETVQTAKDLGVNLEKQNYGLALVLGAGEVKLLEETAGYGVFAAEGRKYEKTPILKIEDSAGRVIEEYQDQVQQVLSPQIARLISDILSDNEARAPVFGPASFLFFPERPVAAKTGTTQRYRDAWTLGYTPSLVAGVWVGNNDGSPMAKAGAGIAAAGPIWNNFMKKAYELRATTVCRAPDFCLPTRPEQFNKPEPILTDKPMLNGSYLTNQIIKVNKISGLLATEQTPPELIEEKVFKEVHSILHYVQKGNPQGEMPTDPKTDPQYQNWEAAVSHWLAQQEGSSSYNQPAPQQPDISQTTTHQLNIKITSPLPGQIIPRSSFKTEVAATAWLGIKQVDYFLDDEFVGSALTPPYSFLILPPPASSNATNAAAAVLRVQIYDRALNRQEDQMTIYFQASE